MVYVPLGSGTPLSLRVRTASHLLSGISALGFERELGAVRLGHRGHFAQSVMDLRHGPGNQVAPRVVKIW